MIGVTETEDGPRMSAKAIRPSLFAVVMRAAWFPTDRTGTKRIKWRVIASQMAAASAASFFWRFVSFHIVWRH